MTLVRRVFGNAGNPASGLTTRKVHSRFLATAASSRDNVRNARPFSDFLTDTFDRKHTYLRISLTERCNLRCVYCMPEGGVPLSPPRELLTSPEIVFLSSLFVSEGVDKIRLTGGEPTVRRDIIPLMRRIGDLRRNGLRELCITTNGVALHRKLGDMVEAGLTGVNLSLDTLDPWQFQVMTRRRGLEAVTKSIDTILQLNKRGGAAVKLKINCVVMRGVNDHEIPAFVDMTREHDLEVRFIEYMPFDGNKWSRAKMVGYGEMLDRIRQTYPGLARAAGEDRANDTSKAWRVPGFVGSIGFITSMTHNFCGTCNRLRITSDGNLKVCLFGNAEVSLRDIVREANGGEPIEDDEAFETAALKESTGETPTAASPSQRLLDVIGAAVKRKKARHAGMGNLEHMKNRPMILIEPSSQSRLRGPPVYGSRPGCGRGGARPDVHIAGFMGATQPRSHVRLFSTSVELLSPRDDDDDDDDDDARDEPSPPPRLTHLTAAGSAHMVPISHKKLTSRTAIAVCSVHFSDPTAVRLIRANEIKKGDVLGAARIAGIMASKRTSDLIPLCHPIALSQVSVDLELADDGGQGDGGGGGGSVCITATVSCEAKTGVEMEALTAASTAALTVYDMCKAVDRGMRVEGLRVVLKKGGKSGIWEMP